MSEPTTARKYYVGLDFLKAFAAIFIVLHHYQQYTGTYYEDSFNFFPLMDSQLHVGYLTILYFMISGFFAESQELREDARGQFKSLPGKFINACASTRWRSWPAGGGGLWTIFCSITLSGYIWGSWSLPCTYGVMTVFVVVVELLAIPLYLFVEKPLAKYMKKYEWKNLRPVDPL